MTDPASFKAHCTANGIAIAIRGSILTLTKHFTPGSASEYTAAESDVSILYDVPGSGGSVWGTDGGSIGGMVGMNGGYMKLNKSGVAKRFISALAKLI